MTQIINIADLDSGDGRTYREVNRDTKHNIEVGKLVELSSGERLRVTRLSRDCDETPLYWLGLEGNTLLRGYAEDDIKPL